MPESASTILFVINPKAGRRHKDDYQKAIQSYFIRLPHTIEFLFLDGKNDAHNLDRFLARFKPQTVVAVGGDGTVSMVAKKVLGTGILLGILPAGSANGMARELNIPPAIEDALKVLVRGVVKKVDVLSVNNLVCIHLSDLGLNARLIKYFERGNIRGRLGYAKVALKVLFRKQYMRVTVKAGDLQLHQKAFMVVIANASKYGTGAVINPSGDLADGKFEVVVVKELGLLTLFKLWLNPHSLRHGNVEVMQASEAHIHTRKRMHFQVDGEYIGKVEQVTVKVLPDKLNLITPE